MGFELGEVIVDLGYAEDEDLVESRSAVAVLPSRRQTWREANERLEVDAAFFEGGVPLVYFRGLSLPSSEEVDEAVQLFHRRAWSQGRAAFLVVVTANEVRILDGRTPWELGPELGRAHTGQAIDTALAVFGRRSVLSGAARSVLKPARRRSVVAVLREALAVAARRLTDASLDGEAANALLGRSMYLRYLDDRGLLIRLTPGTYPVGGFAGALQGEPAAVYELFTTVYERLNGDVFPVTPQELRVVGRDHLDVVADFLRGRPDGQLDLFPLYDFSVVPAELLSNVYEEFIAHHQRESGAYYTPEHIADLVLDEIFPGPCANADVRILDPACGSGTFLARAYRRSIEVSEAVRGRRLSPGELGELLSRSIFGCDLLESALRVAALSCYLVLLDYCTAEEISAGVQLPTMSGKNLLSGDFFELEERLAGPWDVIATNPPWRSRMGVHARDYAKRHDLPVGDQQIAQVFYAACAQRLAPTGRAGLLMPAKVLFNQSAPNRRFRRMAVADTNLDLVVDFSPFRRGLFHSSVAPMALMVLRGNGDPPRDHLTFCTPRRSPVSETLDRIVVSGSEIKRIPRGQAAMSPWYFKATQVGGVRDADLLEGLRRRFPTLAALEDASGWRVGSGYQLGRDATRTAPWLTGSRKVPAAAIDFLTVTSPVSLREGSATFRRTPRAELFQAPLVLFSRTIRRGRLHAVALNEDVAYTASVVGIGPPSLEEAQLVAGILSSSLLRYLLFLMSSTWGVERSALDPQDLRALPIALAPQDSTQRDRLLAIVEAARSGSATAALARDLDETVFDLYRLSDAERVQVQDALLYALDRHEGNSASPAFAQPTQEQLSDYRETLERRLTKLTSSGVLADVTAGQPYTVVRVGLDGHLPPDHHSPEAWGALERAAREHVQTAVLLRRTVRRYDGCRIDLAKPSEARNFTRSAALEDVDDILDDVLRTAGRLPTTHAA